MKLALFILAALLAMAWIVGFFVLNAGLFVHILIITAALFLMQAIIINPKPQPGRCR
jgi:4-hydroxybenzoate polyprenyltransferase